MRFYLLFMLFTGASASLHHAILHRFGLAQSQIPRFILETKHSYLRENSISLEKLSNASEALCNPDSSLRRLIPPVPGDLFKQLTINSKTIGGEQGWDCSREVFTGIASCPAALAGVEELHIDFDPPDSVPPPPDVLDLFVRVLEAPQLKTLSWIRPSASDISNSFLSAFEHHFAHHGLLLPRVRRLTMGPNVHFLVSLAPHVESLATCDGHVWPYPWSWTMPRLLRDPDGPQFNLANATRAARELREFALEGTWVESLVTTLRDAAPGLEKLHMKGQISDKELDVIDYKRAGERLKSLATVLAGFENLRELRLPGVNNLDMGLVNDIFCGNAYDGVSGTKMGIFELLESMSVTEKAVKIVLEELPDLEVICLGSLCANIEYRKPPAWPWTGRVRDYIMESWPRYRGSIHHSSEHEDPDGPVFSTTEEDKEWLEGGKQPGDLDIIQSWEDQWGYDDIQHEEL